MDLLRGLCVCGLPAVDNVLDAVRGGWRVAHALWRRVAPKALFVARRRLLGNAPRLVQVGDDAVPLLATQTACRGGVQLVLSANQQVARGRVTTPVRTSSAILAL